MFSNCNRVEEVHLASLDLPNTLLFGETSIWQLVRNSPVSAMRLPVFESDLYSLFADCLPLRLVLHFTAVRKWGFVQLGSPVNAQNDVS